MSFWNYLGFAWLIDTLFRRKRRYDSLRAPGCNNPTRDARNDDLSDFVDELNRQTHGPWSDLDHDSEPDDLDLYMSNHRDELDYISDDYDYDEFDDDLLDDDF